MNEEKKNQNNAQQMKNVWSIYNGCQLNYFKSIFELLLHNKCYFFVLFFIFCIKSHTINALLLSHCNLPCVMSLLHKIHPYK